MGKNCVIRSVSIPQDLSNFLDMQNLSISELVQEKILEQKRIFDVVSSEKEKLARIIKDLTNISQDHFEYLDETGQTEKFNTWCKEKKKKGGNANGQ